MSLGWMLRRAAPVLLALACFPAHPQLFRAYVASDGSDVNPCTLAQPCRLLPAALAAVASGGEIWMLDSANYNSATVAIAKSVSILAVPGAVGSIVAVGGPAVSISTGGLKVALRNVVIAPLPGGGGTNGVQLTGASSLSIEASLIANLPFDGVKVDGVGRLEIVNSTLRNNGAWAVEILAPALAQAPAAAISGTQLIGNAAGIATVSFGVGLLTGVAITDTTISGPGSGDGLYVYDGSAASYATVMCIRCTIQGTGKALHADTVGAGGASIGVSNSLIMNNTYGWYVAPSPATVLSYGNNVFSNSQTSGSLSPASTQ